MPRKKKIKVEALVTLPQNGSKKRRAGQRVPSGTRLVFLNAFEEHFGNVSVACQKAKIHRRTFYRWMESGTEINRKFQKRISLIRPDEKLVDAAEYTITNGMANGDITAAIFTAKTKGRHRGWTDKPLETAIIASGVLDKLMAQVNAVIEPTMPESEKQLWIRDIAANAGVPEEALMRRLKVLELSK